MAVIEVTGRQRTSCLEIRAPILGIDDQLKAQNLDALRKLPEVPEPDRDLVPLVVLGGHESFDVARRKIDEDQELRAGGAQFGQGASPVLDIVNRTAGMNDVEGFRCGNARHEADLRI